MEQNKLFKSDSQKWDQSEESKKFSDSISGSFNIFTKQRLSDSESLNISGKQIQVNTAMSNVNSWSDSVNKGGQGGFKTRTVRPDDQPLSG